MNEDRNVEGGWISLVLRLAVASLFTATAAAKFINGLDGVAAQFQTIFQATWLPMPLVALHARAVPFIEALIPIWLVVGFRLRWAWIFTALFMVSLAFGMGVAKQYATAADNYLYVLIFCAGLYFSRFDRWSADGLLKNRKPV